MSLGLATKGVLGGGSGTVPVQTVKTLTVVGTVRVVRIVGTVRDS